MQTIKLLSRRKAAPTLFVLEFERPADYSFRAGQFARLGMELEPGAAPVIRGYSIASAPEAPTLEFFITAVKDGKLSPKITALEPGQSVLLDGPAEGSLTPDRIPGGSTLWLLATGSGLSPFASMLRSEAFWAAWKDVVLVLSVRQIEEAVLARELVAALPLERRPKLIVTTTRETDPARFGDLTERIPTLNAKLLPKRAAFSSAAIRISSPPLELNSSSAGSYPRALANPASLSLKIFGNPFFKTMTLPPLRPSAQTIDDLLPQTECRQCGFDGCAAYAQAVADGLAPINRCAPGGARGIAELAKATGLPFVALDPEYGTEMPFARAQIRAEECIGCSWCVRVCPTDAIGGSPKHLREWTREDARKAKRHHEEAWSRRVRQAALEDARLARRREAASNVPAEAAAAAAAAAKKNFMADILAQARARSRQ